MNSCEQALMGSLWKLLTNLAPLTVGFPLMFART